MKYTQTYIFLYIFPMFFSKKNNLKNQKNTDILENSNNYETLNHQNKVPEYFHIKPVNSRGHFGYTGRKLWKVVRIAKNKYLDVTRKRPIATAIASLALMLGGMFIFSQTADNFKASITDTPSPIPFDGAVYPFHKAPNWFVVGGKNTRLYSSYSASELINAPRYEVSKMRSEAWEKETVNRKITYPIVYMGKYKFDHIENTGSHPAVDIKLATGTPVFSIANGIVVKSKTQSTGYGQHIVIRHDSVPTYGTVYSSYSHLSNRAVKVGDVVKKDQQIGKVGSTGNSTTAHIHFQIDKKSAPFFPYWPFTIKDARAAGYNFTTAVNAGFGKANGYKHTINPFTFIHTYTNSSSANIHASAAITTSAPTPKPTIAPKLAGFKLEVSPTKILAGEKVKLTILASDKKKNFLETYNQSVTISYAKENSNKSETIETTLQSGEKNLYLTLNKIGKNTIFVKKGNIIETITVQVVTPKITTQPEVTKIAATEHTLKNKTASVTEITNIPIVSPAKFNHFEITDTHGNTEKTSVKIGEKITVKITAIDDNNKIFKDSTYPPRGSYIIAVKNGKTNVLQVRKGDLSTGEITVIFTAEKAGIGFIKINDAILTINVQSNTPEKIESNNNKKLFTDVSASHKNYNAIKYLKNLNIIGGYDDGSFKPNKTVNRSEALKMILEALDVSITKNLNNPFNDVSSQDWFVNYVLSAYNQKIVGGYNDGTFRPAKTVSRAEYFKILIATSKLPLKGIPANNPFVDVAKTSWFAEYAQFAKENKLLNFGTHFLGSQGVTRAEVAESIYQLIK
ncbi:TPA: hypothetical protein EYP45_03130 [Candidatus Peregrinibacteria bacterium]|nr:hypothetical protein [Candidatus Peregrinibacteria bacterium]